MIKYCLIIILLSLPFCLKASAPVTDTVPKAIIDKMTSLLDTADKYGNALSLNITRVQSGKVPDINQIMPFYNKMTTAVSDLKSQFGVVTHHLSNQEKLNYELHKDNFSRQYDIMCQRITLFTDAKNDVLYSAQIDYTENGVLNFITEAANLKLYLLSFIRIVPDSSLLVKIRKRVDTLQDTMQIHLRSVDNEVSTETVAIENSVNENSKKVIQSLSPKPNPNNLAAVAAYSNDLFGFSYLHGVTSGKKDTVTNYIGLQAVVPVNSVKFNNPGCFISYTVKYNHLMAELGLGYLQAKQANENISWKCSAFFMPNKVGIGVTYSPLTGTGAVLAFQW